MASKKITRRRPLVLITENEIYRLDDILTTINQWFEAFQKGEIVQVPYPYENCIDEYEAHLISVLREEKILRDSESIDF
jgi:hypothetical protein